MLLNWLAAEYSTTNGTTKKLIPVSNIDVQTRVRMDNLGVFRFHSYRNELLFGGSATIINLSAELSNNTLELIRSLIPDSSFKINRKVRLFYEFRRQSQVVKEHTGTNLSGVLNKLRIKASTSSIPTVEMQLLFPTAVTTTTENKPAFNDTYISSKDVSVYYKTPNNTAPVAVQASSFVIEYDADIVPKSSVNNNNSNTFIRDFYLTGQTATCELELVDYSRFDLFKTLYNQHTSCDFIFQFGNLLLSLPDTRITEFVYISKDLAYTLTAVSTGVTYHIITMQN